MFIVFLIVIIGLFLFIFTAKGRREKNVEAAILSLIRMNNHKITNFQYLYYEPVQKYAIENGATVTGERSNQENDRMRFSFFTDNTEYFVYIARANDGSAYISAEPAKIWIDKYNELKRKNMS